MYVIPNVQEIKRRRERAGLSMNELSIKSGLSAAAVFRIESGKTVKTSDLRLTQIAKVLNCNVQDLCNK